MGKNIIILLLITLLAKLAELRPTKTLDQQAPQGPQGFEWEAWLLVSDTSRSSKTDENLKRITPKSIFTVRPFSADTLPPCPEGYRSNTRGNCVKFIKIDEGSHLDYLKDKLTAMYEEGDYDDEVDSDQPVAGPLQFNIPFGEESIEATNPEEPSVNLSNMTGNDGSLVTILDEIFQSDQPPVIRDTKPFNFTAETVNATENVTPTDATNEVDRLSQQQTETIIILFHPLRNKNASFESKNKINESVENVTTLDLDLFQNEKNDSTPASVNETVKPIIKTALTTEQTVIDVDVPTGEGGDDSFVVPFTSSGDYKSSYLQNRFESSDDIITPKVQIESTTTNKPIPKRDTININNDDVIVSSSLSSVNNHRNRDRTIFSRLNHTSKYFTPTTTSERINSKYYTSSIRPYHHSVFRKSLRNSEGLYKKRWSNRYKMAEKEEAVSAKTFKIDIS